MGLRQGERFLPAVSGFVRLKGFLERILEREVDLVTPDAIKERYRESILKDAVRAA